MLQNYIDYQSIVIWELPHIITLKWAVKTVNSTIYYHVNLQNINQSKVRKKTIAAAIKTTTYQDIKIVLNGGECMKRESQ